MPGEVRKVGREKMRFSQCKILSLLFFLVFALQFNLLFAKAEFKRDPQQGMSYHMLRIAKEAHENGDFAEAKRIWMQVRAISPSMPEPEWLNKPLTIERAEPQETNWTRQKLIYFVDTQGFTPEVVLQLNNWVSKYPNDRLIRILLLSHAILTNDQSAVIRHQSLLQNNQESVFNLMTILKIIISIVILGAGIWQLIQLKRELPLKK